jgi:protein-S-isoprenylcysteine O-methyltransferase Ste14
MSTASANTLRAPLPPPVAFFVILGAGVLAAHLRPFPLLPEGLGYRLAFGLPFFATALSIGVWSFSAFRRYSTSPQFGKAVSRLIQHGPYRFSRNPLYIALLLVLLGFAFTLNNAWLASGVFILWYRCWGGSLLKSGRFSRDQLILAPWSLSSSSWNLPSRSGPK